MPVHQSLFDSDEMQHALLHQAEQCGALGSRMYADLFTDLATDYQDGGRTYALLAGRSERPLHDAIPLRLAGAIHRVVLQGKEPRLARHYPSMGGKPGEDFTPDFIGYMRDHLDAIEAGLASHVQTNEVGRSIVPLVLSHWLTTFDITEFDYLEVGASAGLNMNFDDYYACYGPLRMGNPGSQLRFMGDWFATAPQVPRVAAQVVNRRGVDVSPIDVSNDDDVARLLSFVWPDQIMRLDRLRAAIGVAQLNKPIIDVGSADTWIERQLLPPRPRATMVFHSIVWQYLGEDVQRRFKQHLIEAGSGATKKNPLIWARMEPAGKVADVRATVWRGTKTPKEYRLADIAYHGQDMRWF